MFQTITKPGLSLVTLTEGNINKYLPRVPLSDGILKSAANPAMWPTIFLDYPEYDFFEVEFQGTHTHTTTNFLYFRYCTSGGEYSNNIYFYNYSGIYSSTTSGSAGTSGSSIQLTPNGLSANSAFGFKIRMHPNRPVPLGSSSSEGGKHPMRFAVGTHGSTPRYTYLGGGGFYSGGSAPDIMSGFSLYTGSGAFSANSRFQVYGLNNAATVMV